MSLEAAITFFIAIFVFGITPGPGVFAIMARALVAGTSSCYSLALGMSISDMIYLLLAIFGLSAIAENWSGAFTVIRYLGAAYLFYLGWKMWTAKVDIEQEPNAGENHLSGTAGFIQGFLISASNPKVILFYIAFLPTFMDLTRLTTHDIVLACLLTVVALMLGLMLIAWTAASAKQRLRSQRGVKMLNRAAGSMMMGAGLFLAFKR